MTEEELHKIFGPPIGDETLISYEEFQKKKRLKKFLNLVKMGFIFLFVHFICMSLYLLFLFAIGVIKK